MNRLIELLVLVLCSPRTSVVVASVSALALGATLVLRYAGE